MRNPDKYDQCLLLTKALRRKMKELNVPIEKQRKILDQIENQESTEKEILVIEYHLERLKYLKQTQSNQ